MISRRSINQESLRSIDVKLPQGTELLSVNEKEVPECAGLMHHINGRSLTRRRDRKGNHMTDNEQLIMFQSWKRSFQMNRTTTADIQGVSVFNLEQA